MIALLTAPALVLIAVIFGWPMLRYVWLSFHADSVLTGLQPVANGGANWLRLLADDRFWIDAGQTARFALLSVGLELILALGMALLLNQSWRGRGAARAVAELWLGAWRLASASCPVRGFHHVPALIKSVAKISSLLPVICRL